MKKFVGMLALLGLGILGFALETRAVDVHFSNADLHGTYVVKFQGTNSGGDGALEGKSLAPLNGVGQLMADGKGHFAGTQTANILFNT